MVTWTTTSSTVQCDATRRFHCLHVCRSVRGTMAAMATPTAQALATTWLEVQVELLAPLLAGV